MSQEMFMALMRHVFTLAGTYLVSAGYVQAASVETLVGAGLILAGAGWSALKARQNKKTIVSLKNDAIASSANIQDLKAEVIEEKAKH